MKHYVPGWLHSGDSWAILSCSHFSSQLFCFPLELRSVLCHYLLLMAPIRMFTDLCLLWSWIHVGFGLFVFPNVQVPQASLRFSHIRSVSSNDSGSVSSERWCRVLAPSLGHRVITALTWRSVEGLLPHLALLRTLFRKVVRVSSMRSWGSRPCGKRAQDTHVLFDSPHSCPSPMDRIKSLRREKQILAV